MPSKPSTALSFILAVLLATLLASIFQTQSNLAALQALGAPVPLAVRLGTTGLDLIGFGPVFALLCAMAFALALPVAAWGARRVPLLQLAIFALAGAVAICTVLTLANLLAPMPTLIAADRSDAGRLGLMACGAAGALLFALLRRRRLMPPGPASSLSPE